MADASPDISPPPGVPLPEALDLVNPAEHRALYRAVYDALFALPSLFATELSVSGVLATDLFTFNSSLGATIETQVVAALNGIRSAWDPDQEYATYSFVRQAQRFPDVILRSAAVGKEPAILMGVELKGWYVLAKEREPSFRYRVTPAACAPADLLVVYPWALSNVVSGSPRLFAPYVQTARHAAEYRNWHWRHGRTTSGDRGITLSTARRCYPPKTDPISDVPRSDNGGNFGRFARSGLMDEYMAQVYREKLAGIPLDAWQRFLAIFSEDSADADVLRRLERMAADVRQGRADLSAETVEAVRAGLLEVAELLGRPGQDG